MLFDYLMYNIFKPDPNEVLNPDFLEVWTDIVQYIVCRYTEV